MNAANQTTSTSGSGSCNSMGGGWPGHRHGPAANSGLVFSALAIGTRFLDLAFGSWWVKANGDVSICNDYEDSAFATCEVARFGPNEAVSLDEPVSDSDRTN